MWIYRKKINTFNLKFYQLIILNNSYNIYSIWDNHKVSFVLFNIDIILHRGRRHYCEFKSILL